MGDNPFLLFCLHLVLGSLITKMWMTALSDVTKPPKVMTTTFPLSFPCQAVEIHLLELTTKCHQESATGGFYDRLKTGS